MSAAAETRVAPLGRGLADENTPFIRDAWYVAATSEEVAPGSMLARKLLGERVMLYRRADGGVAALRDQCPHRAFPLSRSALDGDDVVCGYHGFRYGPDGRCKAVPSQATVPASLAVRAFPIIEQAPLIWIWMGDPAQADPASLPAQDWMRPEAGWARSNGYLHVRASYVHLHENLLDLSHLTFLHAKTFGTPDYALAPFETETEGGHIVVRRIVQPTRLPPVYARPLDMEGKDAARIVTSTFVSPAMSISAVVLRNLELPQAERTDHHIRTAQLLTPEDANAVHYHFLIARDFVPGDEEITAFIHRSIRAAFDEDVFALEELTRVRLDSPEQPVREMSVASDRAGVALRRQLRRLAEREQAATG